MSLNTEATTDFALSLTRSANSPSIRIMSKPAYKALTLLLTVLLATCWVVGEAWHLLPGMAHLDEYSGGCLIVGAAPCKTAAIPLDCNHGNVQHQSPCPLKVLSAEQCPICRTLSQHQTTCMPRTVKPLPELVHARQLDRAPIHICKPARTADARAPPA